MARRRSGRSRTLSGVSPRRAARLAFGAGRLLVAAGLPLAVGTFLLLLLDAGGLQAGLATAGTALTVPLTAGGGVPWLFHVGALASLAGAWLAGLGLLLDGLFG